MGGWGGVNWEVGIKREVVYVGETEGRHAGARFIWLLGWVVVAVARNLMRSLP